MRRAFILLLLLGGLRLLEPLGRQEPASETLLAFGFLVLAAYTVGEIASAVRLPKIVGYLAAGILFGPYALGTVSAAGVDRLGSVSRLAIALIAFLAGAELKWGDVRARGVLYLKVMSAELLVAFVAITVALVVVAGAIPFLTDLALGGRIAVAMLFASMAIVHSPAVTLALLSETRAKGPVSQTTLGVVLLADVAVVLLFSGALALARTLVPSTGDVEAAGLGLLVWEITGALMVGALLGALVSAYLRFVGRELFLFAILVAYFGLLLADVLHLEVLLTLLTAGFVTENISKEGEELRHAMERSAAPVFVVFFALSGAKIDVQDVVALLPLVLPLAAVRAGAMWAGARLGGRWAGASDPERRLVWMGLVSQAGVAIGLAAIVAEAYPNRGPQIAALMLALIAINETLGPILFRRALLKSGEAEGEPIRRAAGAAASSSPKPRA